MQGVWLQKFMRLHTLVFVAMEKSYALLERNNYCLKISKQNTWLIGILIFIFTPSSHNSCLIVWEGMLRTFTRSSLLFLIRLIISPESYDNGTQIIT